MKAATTSTRNSRALMKEIFIIILIKVIALYIIWLCFFSHPIDHQIDRASLTTRILQ